jgi:hypothetical protein
VYNIYTYYIITYNLQKDRNYAIFGNRPHRITLLDKCQIGIVYLDFFIGLN